MAPRNLDMTFPFSAEVDLTFRNCLESAIKASQYMDGKQREI